EIDAGDFVERHGERLGVAARSTAGIQGPASVSRQLREQPVQDVRLLQPGKTIVVRSKSIKRLCTAHAFDNRGLYACRVLGKRKKDSRGNASDNVSLSIGAEAFESPDAQRLIAALDARLAELYPPEQRFGPNLKADHLDRGQGTFLVAREDGRAVGCGAIRLLDPTTAEAKRMYVEPDQRGRGVGSVVLAGLEAAARQLGVRRLVLETGIYQDAALSLYRRAGFTQIDCWGEYASSPTSICLEKHLV